MVGELAVVADGDVLLLPVLVERLLAAFVEVALFDGDGAAAAQLGRLQPPLLVPGLPGRREQVRAAPVLPAAGRLVTVRPVRSARFVLLVGCGRFEDKLSL